MIFLPFSDQHPHFTRQQWENQDLVSMKKLEHLLENPTKDLTQKQEMAG